MKNNLLIDVLIFSILIFIPLVLILTRINLWDEDLKKEKIIQGKIESAYKGYKNENPVVRRIVNKERLSSLDFSDKIENNDLIFIYENKGIVVYADDKTGKIIGISNVK